MIAISNKNAEMLEFLLNGLYYLWTAKHIAIVVREVIHSNWVGSAMKIIVNGKCFKKVLSDELQG
jgi:hypothetical protein